MKITARKLFLYSFRSALNVGGLLNVNVTISTGISSESEEFVVFSGRGMLLFARNTTQK
jgi:hypothetical protein